MSCQESKNTVAVMPVNGTDSREAHPKRWIAAMVKMHCERKVGDTLNSLNIENWVPTQIVIRQWSDRKKNIERVVIPMVVFVRIDSEQEKRLRMYSFILKVLSYPGRWDAAVIPDEQIAGLRLMLKQTSESVEIENKKPFAGRQSARRQRPYARPRGPAC